MDIDLDLDTCGRSQREGEADVAIADVAIADGRLAVAVAGTLALGSNRVIAGLEIIVFPHGLGWAILASNSKKD